MTHDIEQEEGGWKINGNLKTMIIIMWGVLTAVNAYAFFYKFPTIEEDIKKNTEQVAKIDTVLSEIKYMRSDIDEFKRLLKRTTPYERSLR